MPRPRERLLDVDRIAAAALELADQNGSFTVAELAARLTVHPSSLYHHVTGREEVVELMRAAVGREIDASGFGVVAWDAAITRMAWSYRAAFARHAGSIRLLATTRVQDAESLLAYERIAAALVSAGFRIEDVLAVVVALDNFVLGSALDLAGGSDAYAAERSLHPHLAAALVASQSDGRRNPADRAFELGLDALLQGFRNLIYHTAPAMSVVNDRQELR